MTENLEDRLLLTAEFVVSDNLDQLTIDVRGADTEVYLRTDPDSNLLQYKDDTNAWSTDFNKDGTADEVTLNRDFTIHIGTFLGVDKSNARVYLAGIETDNTVLTVQSSIDLHVVGDLSTGTGALELKSADTANVFGGTFQGTSSRISIGSLDTTADVHVDRDNDGMVTVTAGSVTVTSEQKSKKSSLQVIATDNINASITIENASISATGPIEIDATANAGFLLDDLTKNVDSDLAVNLISQEIGLLNYLWGAFGKGLPVTVFVREAESDITISNSNLNAGGDLTINSEAVSDATGAAVAGGWSEVKIEKPEEGKRDFLNVLSLGFTYARGTGKLEILGDSRLISQNADVIASANADVTSNITARTTNNIDLEAEPHFGGGAFGVSVSKTNVHALLDDLSVIDAPQGNVYFGATGNVVNSASATSSTYKNGTAGATVSVGYDEVDIDTVVLGEINTPQVIQPDPRQFFQSDQISSDGVTITIPEHGFEEGQVVELSSDSSRIFRVRVLDANRIQLYLNEELDLASPQGDPASTQSLSSYETRVFNPQTQVSMDGSWLDPIDSFDRVIRHEQPFNLYRNWSPNEPNNSNGIEHYAQMQPDGFWNDNNGSTKLSYLLELNDEYSLIERDGGFTWWEAAHDAQVLGGQLAVIENADDQERAVQKANNNSVWIGATDEGQEGRWTWVVADGYQNWATGQPDNFSGNAHFAHLQADGTWSDLPGDDILDGYLLEIAGDYTYIPGSTNWSDAYQDSTARGGKLATIHSQDEQDLAADVAAGRNAWIGATDAGREGTWVWGKEESSFTTGQKLYYGILPPTVSNPSEPIENLYDDATYYAIVDPENVHRIQLAESEADAFEGINIPLDGLGQGEQHFLTFVSEVRDFSPVSDLDEENNSITIDTTGLNTGDPLLYRVDPEISTSVEINRNYGFRVAGIQLDFDAMGIIDLGQAVLNSSVSTLTIPNHGWETGDEVVYFASDPQGNESPAILVGEDSELVDEGSYYVIKVDADTIQLSGSRESLVAIEIVDGGESAIQVLQDKQDPSHSFAIEPSGTVAWPVVDPIKNTLLFESPHGLVDGQRVSYSAGQSLDGSLNQPIVGLVDGTDYYVSAVNDYEIQLTATRIDLSGRGIFDGLLDASAGAIAFAPDPSGGEFTPSSLLAHTVDTKEDWIISRGHELEKGQAVTYGIGDGTAIGGLVEGATYYVVPLDGNTIRLASSRGDVPGAARGQAASWIDLQSGATGDLQILMTAKIAFPFQAARTSPVVDTQANTIELPAHGLSDGQLVEYHTNNGEPVGGLEDDQVYGVKTIDANHIQLVKVPDREYADQSTPVGAVIPLGDGATLETGSHLFRVIPTVSLPDRIDPLLLFDPIAVLPVDLDANMIRVRGHRLTLGDSLRYLSGDGNPIGGLEDGAMYYAIPVFDAFGDPTPWLKLANSPEQASDGQEIDLLPGATGIAHSIKVASTARQSDLPIRGLLSEVTYYAIVDGPSTLRLAETPEDALGAIPQVVYTGIALQDFSLGSARPEDFGGINVESSLTSKNKQNAGTLIGGAPTFSDFVNKPELLENRVLGGGGKAFPDYRTPENKPKKFESKNYRDIKSFSLSVGVAINIVEHCVQTTVGSVEEGDLCDSSHAKPHSSPAKLNGENIQIVANIKQLVQTKAQGNTIVAPGKKFVASAGVAVSDVNNRARAVLGSDAVVDAVGSIDVHSNIEYPLLIEKRKLIPGNFCYDSRQGKAEAECHPIKELATYLDGSFGLSRVLNTWANSKAFAAKREAAYDDGTKNALPKYAFTFSVGVASYNNTSEAIIESGARINTHLDDAFLAYSTVTVDADIDVTLVGLAGIMQLKLNDGAFQFAARQPGFNSIGNALSFTANKSESFGLGASTYIQTITNNAIAAVQKGATIRSGKSQEEDEEGNPVDRGTTVQADSRSKTFNFTQSGADSEGGAVALSLGVTRDNSQTVAYVDQGVSIESQGPLRIDAENEALHSAGAGGFAFGDTVGVGLSSTIISLERHTGAFLGETPEPWSDLSDWKSEQIVGESVDSPRIQAANLILEASNKGQQTAASVVGALAKGNHKAAGAQRDQRTDSKSKTHIGVAGDASVNLAVDKTTAQVDFEGEVTVDSAAQDALGVAGTTVSAENSTDFLALAGAASIAWNGSRNQETASVALAAAVAVNDLDLTTEAMIGGDAVIPANSNEYKSWNLGALSLTSESSGDVFALAVALGIAQLKDPNFSLNAAFSYAFNPVDDKVHSFLLPLANAGYVIQSEQNTDLLLSAHNSRRINATSGAVEITIGSASVQLGIGVSPAVNDVNIEVFAEIQTGVVLTTDAVTLDALSEAAIRAWSVAGGGRFAGKAPTVGVDVNGSMAINRVNTQSRALIGPANGSDSQWAVEFAEVSDVTVRSENRDDLKAMAGEGFLAVGQGASVSIEVGLAFSLNEISKDSFSKAMLVGVHIPEGKGDINVSSRFAPQLKAVAVAVSVGIGFGQSVLAVSGVGAVGLNIVGDIDHKRNNTDQRTVTGVKNQAGIFDSSISLLGLHSVFVAATAFERDLDHPYADEYAVTAQVHSIELDIDLGKTTVSVDVGISYTSNQLAVDTSATITESDILQVTKVTLDAINGGSIHSAASSSSFGFSFGTLLELGYVGTFTINVVENKTEAFIEGGQIDVVGDSSNSSGLYITAKDDSLIQAFGFAGQLGIAVSSDAAQVSGSITSSTVDNWTENTIFAGVKGGNTADASDNRINVQGTVDIQAHDYSQLRTENYAVGVGISGSGQGASISINAAVGISKNTVENEVVAQVVGVELDVSGDLVVQAAAHPNHKSLTTAIGISGAFSAGLGSLAVAFAGSSSVNHVGGSVSALIGDTSNAETHVNVGGAVMVHADIVSVGTSYSAESIAPAIAVSVSATLSTTFYFSAAVSGAGSWAKSSSNVSLNAAIENAEVSANGQISVHSVDESQLNADSNSTAVAASLWAASVGLSNSQTINSNRIRTAITQATVSSESMDVIVKGDGQSALSPEATTTSVAGLIGTAVADTILQAVYRGDSDCLSDEHIESEDDCGASITSIIQENSNVSAPLGKVLVDARSSVDAISRVESRAAGYVAINVVHERLWVSPSVTASIDWSVVQAATVEVNALTNDLAKTQMRGGDGGVFSISAARIDSEAKPVVRSEVSGGARVEATAQIDVRAKSTSDAEALLGSTSDDNDFSGNRKLSIGAVTVSSSDSTATLAPDVSVNLADAVIKSDGRLTVEAVGGSLMQTGDAYLFDADSGVNPISDSIVLSEEHGLGYGAAVAYSGNSTTLTNSIGGLTPFQTYRVIPVNSQMIQLGSGLVTGSQLALYQSESGVTWQEAAALAETAGGRLGAIANDSQNRYLLSLVPDNERVWIGGSDDRTEGDWYWNIPQAEGQLFWTDGMPYQDAYTDWANGQPESSDQSLDYAAIEKNSGGQIGSWYALSGLEKLNYFVVASPINRAIDVINDELNFSDVPYLHGAAPNDGGASGEDALSIEKTGYWNDRQTQNKLQAYVLEVGYDSAESTFELKVDDTGNGFTFREAIQAAQEQNGRVAWVQSEADNQTIKDLLLGAEVDNAWLGANDFDEEGSWIWYGSTEAFWYGGLFGNSVDNAFTNFAPADRLIYQAGVLPIGGLSDGSIYAAREVASSESSIKLYDPSSVPSPPQSFDGSDVSGADSITIPAHGFTDGQVVTYRAAVPTEFSSEDVENSLLALYDDNLAFTDPTNDSPVLSNASAVVYSSNATDDQWYWLENEYEQDVNGFPFWPAFEYQDGIAPYQNWSVDEPNNSNGSEDSAVLRQDGYWNDLDGNTTLNGYLLERPQFILSSYETDTAGLQNLLNTYPGTWAATIVNENEWEAAKKAADGKDVYLGGSDAGHKNLWTWTTESSGPESGREFWDGKSTGDAKNEYETFWANGEPNDRGLGNAETQLLMYGDSGEWNDVSASEKHYWLLESKQFTYISFSGTIKDAKADAKTKGGWLATIRSAEENELATEAMQNELNEAWIGARSNQLIDGLKTGKTYYVYRPSTTESYKLYDNENDAVGGSDQNLSIKGEDKLSSIAHFLTKADEQPIEGLVDGQSYYVIKINDNDFQLAASSQDWMSRSPLALSGIDTHTEGYTGVIGVGSTLGTEGLDLTDVGQGVHSFVLDITGKGAGEQEFTFVSSGLQNAFDTDFRYGQARAVTTGGGFAYSASVGSPQATATSNPNVNVIIDSGASLQGKNVDLLTVSHANAEAYTNNRFIGLGFASTTSKAETEANETSRITISGAVRADVDLTVRASNADTLQARALTSGGGLFPWTNSYSKIDHDYNTTVLIDAFSELQAGNLISIDAITSFDDELTSQVKSGGALGEVHANRKNDDSDWGVLVGTETDRVVTSVEVAQAQLHAKSIEIDAVVKEAQITSYAEVRAIGGMPKKATALSRLYDDTKVVFLDGATLIAEDALSIQAMHDNIQVHSHANLYRDKEAWIYSLATETKVDTRSTIQANADVNVYTKFLDIASEHDQMDVRTRLTYKRKDYGSDYDIKSNSYNDINAESRHNDSLPDSQSFKPSNILDWNASVRYLDRRYVVIDENGRVEEILGINLAGVTTPLTYQYDLGDTIVVDPINFRSEDLPFDAQGFNISLLNNSSDDGVTPAPTNLLSGSPRLGVAFGVDMENRSQLPKQLSGIALDSSVDISDKLMASIQVTTGVEDTEWSPESYDKVAQYIGLYRLQTSGADLIIDEDIDAGLGQIELINDGGDILSNGQGGQSINLIAAAITIDAPSGRVVANPAVPDSEPLTAQKQQRSLYSEHILIRDPDAFWRLGELSGNEASDSSGNANHGTLGSNVALNYPGAVPGGNGPARFSGDSQGYVQGPDFTLNELDGQTVSGWFLVESTDVDGQAIYFLGSPGEGPTDYTDNGSNRENTFWIHQDGSLHMAVGLAGQTGQTSWTTDPGLVEPGRWYHFATLLDAQQGRMSIFLNGEIVATNTFTSGQKIRSEPGDWVLGNSPSKQSGFKGRLDEIAIFNRALTETQVDDLYVAFGPSADARWRMDESGGSRMTDDSINQIDGEYLKATHIDDSAPFGRGAAARFDGSSDSYAVVLHDERLNSFRAQTISTWFKPDSVQTTTAQTIFAKSLLQLSSGTEVALKIDETGHLVLSVPLSNGSTEMLNTPVLDFSNDHWYHVAVVIDAEEQSLQIFVDGEATSDPISTSSTFSIPRGDWYLANDSEGSSGFQGMLWGFSVFDEALTPREIAAQKTLVYWYPSLHQSSQISAGGDIDLRIGATAFDANKQASFASTRLQTGGDLNLVLLPAVEKTGDTQTQSDYLYRIGSMTASGNISIIAEPDPLDDHSVGIDARFAFGDLSDRVLTVDMSGEIWLDDQGSVGGDVLTVQLESKYEDVTLATDADVKIQDSITTGPGKRMVWSGTGQLLGKGDPSRSDVDAGTLVIAATGGVGGITQELQTRINSLEGTFPSGPIYVNNEADSLSVYGLEVTSDSLVVVTSNRLSVDGPVSVSGGGDLTLVADGLSLSNRSPDTLYPIRDQVDLIYENWNTGEPNNYGGIENFAAMSFLDGKWNDLNGSESLGGYLLEKDGEYSLQSGVFNWWEAARHAQQQGGQLAVIRTQAEQELAFKEIGGTEVWIGASDQEEEGRWTWAVARGYQNWATGQPDNASGVEHFAHLNSDGTWSDFPGDDILEGYLLEIAGDYTYIPGPTNWFDAYQDAISRGGKLAIIHSQSEQRLAASVASGRDAWIGATDIYDPGHWAWLESESLVVGAPVRTLNGSGNLNLVGAYGLELINKLEPIRHELPFNHYANWYTGEPNNYEGIENFAAMRVDGTWNDVPGDFSFNYLLEVNDEYSLIVGSFTWWEAAFDAQRRGGQLAVIENDEDQLRAAQEATGKEAWIGATDAGHEGRWTWVVADGYQNWATGQPDNVSGNEHFAHLQADGTWNDLPGDSTLEGYLLEIEREFTYITSDLNWSEAFEDAISRGGHLATIHNRSEQARAADVAAGRNAWIGASDAGREGTWVWGSIPEGDLVTLVSTSGDGQIVLKTGTRYIDGQLKELFDEVSQTTGLAIRRATITDVSASSSYDSSSEDAVINGAGLTPLGFHAVDPDGTMWLSRGTLATPYDLDPEIVFDLGFVQNLDHMKVWNYNESQSLGRGVSQADIYVAGEDQQFTAAILGQTFEKAPGSATIDFSQIIDLSEWQARYVKLDNLLAFPDGDGEVVGLSEVQFYVQRESPKANIVMAPGTRIESESGNVVLLAAGDVQLSSIETHSSSSGDGAVLVLADYDGVMGGYPDGESVIKGIGNATHVTADLAAFVAEGFHGIQDWGIGRRDDPLRTDVRLLAAMTDFGDIAIENTGDLTIGRLDVHLTGMLSNVFEVSSIIPMQSLPTRISDLDTQGDVIGYDPTDGVFSISGLAILDEDGTVDKSYNLSVNSTNSLSVLEDTPVINLSSGKLTLSALGDGPAENLFSLVTGSFDWNSAYFDAITQGGRLANITTSEIADQVASLVPGNYWIGASDSESEGDWYWLYPQGDGTARRMPFDYFNFSQWNDGEPNNFDGNEDYAEVVSSNNLWKWNDLIGTQSLGYVLEKPPATKLSIQSPLFTAGSLSEIHLYEGTRDLAIPQPLPTDTCDYYHSLDVSGSLIQGSVLQLSLDLCLDPIEVSPASASLSVRSASASFSVRSASALPTVQLASASAENESSDVRFFFSMIESERDASTYADGVEIGQSTLLVEKSGSNKVYARVLYSDGSYTDYEKTIEIADLPFASLDVTQDETILSEDFSVTLLGQFVDLGKNDRHLVVIDWGDQSSVDVMTLGEGAASFDAVHRYDQAGRYHATVTVVDVESNDFITRQIWVNARKVVPVDIKPGGFPNSINLKNRGTVPVVILSTDDFNAAAEVDPDSLTFGRTGSENSLSRNREGEARCAAEDVNNDGLEDLVCRFDTQASGFEAGDTEGILRSETFGGVPLEGRDSVRILADGRPLLVEQQEPPGEMLGNAAIHDTAEVARIDEHALQHVTTAAIDYWRSSGVTADQLSSLAEVDIHIVDLSGALLGLAHGSGAIWLDHDAAGFGWARQAGHLALGDQRSGRIDLVTVVTHEFGHLLGFDHDDHDHEVMNAVLSPGSGWVTQLDTASLAGRETARDRVADAVYGALSSQPVVMIDRRSNTRPLIESLTADEHPKYDHKYLSLPHHVYSPLAVLSDRDLETMLRELEDVDDPDDVWLDEDFLESITNMG